ncbi:hypothetical protein NLJ89_g6905 [Agrocybe chaxingu]|uniref:Ubiquitin-like domain-containing protein n=1 Tax=Agrocybe chaxingu TaxID=84603 RepID=A0A9W8MTM4_9AGAR|nr:hypothetical protein NLJ89_g6905 [Agrocybe chaxingu]
MPSKSWFSSKLWAKVIAVRRNREPRDESAHSPPRETNAGEGPTLPDAVRPHDGDPAIRSDDSRGRQVLEGVMIGLAVVAPIAEAIPVVGTPLKAAVGGLLEILKAADQIIQNREEVRDLEERLRWLQDHLVKVPDAACDDIRERRADLTRKLDQTLKVLKELGQKHVFRFSKIAQKISQSSKDIDHYLARYSALSIMHTENTLERIEAGQKQMQEHWAAFIALAPRDIPGRMTGIILVDATRKEHLIPMDHAASYEMFMKYVAQFFAGDKLEVTIQQQYMECGMYDLCVDKGTEVVPINGQQDWSKIPPGTKVVMSVILWNKPDDSSTLSTIDCPGCEGRFQMSEAEILSHTIPRRLKASQGIRTPKLMIPQGVEMGVIQNYHLKQNIVRDRVSTVSHLNSSGEDSDKEYTWSEDGDEDDDRRKEGDNEEGYWGDKGDAEDSYWGGEGGDKDSSSQKSDKEDDGDRREEVDNEDGSNGENDEEASDSTIRNAIA